MSAVDYINLFVEYLMKLIALISSFLGKKEEETPENLPA